MPKWHDCPPLPAGSPLRVLMTPVMDDVLQTRALLFGCPSDVRLRPGEQSGTSVQFGCPGATEPTIVLRGRGSVPFPVSDPLHEYQREVTELYKLRDVIGRLPEKRFFYGLRKDPVPRCATKPLGLVVVVTDYRRVDWIAERLTGWIRHDDLNLEVIIKFLPPGPPETLMRER
jgi:hypothetical protein